ISRVIDVALPKALPPGQRSSGVCPAQTVGATNTSNTTHRLNTPFILTTHPSCGFVPSCAFFNEYPGLISETIATPVHRIDVMAEFNLQDTIALLARTPATLDALLRDLPEAWTHRNEGGDSWTAYDVVGHLIHGERTDWMPRARRILESGDSRAFDPFDRLAQQRDSQGKTLPQLLDEFARLRSENLDALRTLNLHPADFERRGRHPALGVVTLSQLLATWAAHDLTHLHQLSRIMAHQYRDAVGPWTK